MRSIFSFCVLLGFILIIATSPCFSAESRITQQEANIEEALPCTVPSETSQVVFMGM